MRDVIEMAREAGLRSAVLLYLYGKEDALCDSEIEELRQIERLVALVRADEREQALAAPVQEPETDSCGSGAGCLYKVAMIENLESEVERLKAAQPAPVQPFDHQQAANTALRESMNRSVVIAKNTVPIFQKRPPNCGTGYCSCVECVMEPAAQPAPVQPVMTDEKGRPLTFWGGKSVEPRAQPAPVQPVAWMQSDEVHISLWKDDYHTIPLYTTPPASKRQWVGLTDEERTEIRREHYARTLPLMDAVEAKLRSKNT